jgi:hypothetical protein
MSSEPTVLVTRDGLIRWGGDDNSMRMLDPLIQLVLRGEVRGAPTRRTLLGALPG